MSSHHVVREKQEPALLVLSLQNFSPEFLGQLLEWSPTVIATTDSFEELNSNEIKVDWLVAEPSSTAPQNDVKFINAGSSGDLQVAINELIKNGYAAVNIITDNADLPLFEDYVERINLVIYAANEKIFPIKPGYSKWLPGGEIIGIKELPKGLIMSGTEKLSDDNYRTIGDGIISFQFEQPFLFISENL